jgi:uncharacterized membrane protein
VTSILAAISAALTLASTGAIAGLYFAFSVSVMRGFDEIRADQAIPAMQRINQRIQNPVFLLTFIGAPIAGIVTGALLLSLDQTRAAVLFFVAAAIYVLGSLAPTAIVNVPMNNRLDAASVPVDPEEAARMWDGYSGRWTSWNTARGVATTASLLVIGLALFVWGREG